MSSIPPEYLNQIVTGDARELAKRIPDESIDLILCDPIYWEIEDYRWLSVVAKRILKPGGNCIVQHGQEFLPKVLAAMSENLTYYWQWSERICKTARMWNKRIFVRWKPWLWFVNGDTVRLGGWTLDSIYSPPDKSIHEWGDGIENAISIVRFLTEGHSIIFDPFTGGGTVPAACKVLERNYIAFEIDSDTAERARQRVANTQPPLFVAMPEQMTLESA